MIVDIEEFYFHWVVFLNYALKRVLIDVQEVDERREGEERMEGEEEERIQNERERERKERRNYVLLSKVTRSRSKGARNM